MSRQPRAHPQRSGIGRQPRAHAQTRREEGHGPSAVGRTPPASRVQTRERHGESNSPIDPATETILVAQSRRLTDMQA